MKAIFRFILQKLVAAVKLVIKTLFALAVPAIFGLLFSSLVLMNTALFGLANSALARLGLDTASSALERSAQKERLAKRSAAKEIRGKAIGRAKASAKRNITAMPLEAVPVLGVATVLTVTAWEIDDLCQIVIHIDELSTIHDPETTSDEVTELCKSWRMEVKKTTDIVKEAQGTLTGLMCDVTGNC